MNNVNQQGMSGSTLLLVSQGDLEKVIENVMMTFFEKMTREMNSTKADDVLLNEDEVQQLLGVGHATLWRWNRDKYLCNVKIGRRVLWRKSDIDAILNR